MRDLGQRAVFVVVRRWTRLVVQPVEELGRERRDDVVGAVVGHRVRSDGVSLRPPPSWPPICLHTLALHVEVLQRIHQLFKRLTAEEAALNYARLLGREASQAETAKMVAAMEARARVYQASSDAAVETSTRVRS